MDKVFLVTHVMAYEATTLIGVFTTREKAEAASRDAPLIEVDSEYESIDIVEVLLDDVIDLLL